MLEALVDKEPAPLQVLRNGDRLLVSVPEETEDDFCSELLAKLGMFLGERADVMIVRGPKIVVMEGERC